MKNVMLLLGITAVTFTACNDGTTHEKTGDSTTAIAAAPKMESKTDEPWVAVDSATEMKAWEAYATPGEAHKALAKSDGNWTGETKMWMGVGAAPMTSTTTITNKMALGGRYQLSTVKGNMMGMPFEGMGTTGYDNFKKKYISTWMDNMGTGIMNMEGTWDAASKSITFTGKMICPSNGRDCNMREVYTMIDDNTELMEMYGPDPKTGKEYKTMEIKLTRKK